MDGIIKGKPWTGMFWIVERKTDDLASDALSIPFLIEDGL